MNTPDPSAVLLTELRGPAMLLTLNRPAAMNALSNALVARLREAVATAAQSAARAIVISGAGAKAFSAGTDLKERRTLDEAQKAAQSQSLLKLTTEIAACPLPVIAAIGGWCLGGGLELALGCDLRIAADDARFGFPEMTLGAYPGSGGAVTLPRVIGAARAKEIFFRARRLDANEAAALGLVQQVVPRARLLDEALTWVSDMAMSSPLALAALKRSIQEAATLPLAEAMALDQNLRRPLDTTRDYEEGLRAHFEKRTPVFRGE